MAGTRHLMLLDFDPDVNGIVSQPFWLFWPEGHSNTQRPARETWFVDAATNAGGR